MGQLSNTASDIVAGLRVLRASLGRYGEEAALQASDQELVDAVVADLARVAFAGTLAIWHEHASVAYLNHGGLSKNSRDIWRRCARSLS